MNEQVEKGRAVLRYEEKTDSHGNKVMMPIYLKTTPAEETARMNGMYDEWKTTKQIKYNTEVVREEEKNA